MGTPVMNHNASASGQEGDDLQSFERLAAQWWDTEGPHALLHRINPCRIAYIRDCLFTHFDRAGLDRTGLDRIDPDRFDQNHRPLEGLRILDVGCGGGLLCVPLARLGADVTGIDPGKQAIQVAQHYAKTHHLAITYACAPIDEWAQAGLRYDGVFAMEVVEHLADPVSFLNTCAALVKPGGVFIGSTLNRTLKSRFLSLILAEHVLRWLPVGTHRYERFMRPSEFARILRHAGLQIADITGLRFDILSRDWQLCEDVAVNYFIHAHRALN